MERRRPSHARHSDAQRTLLAAAALIASGAWASSAAAQTFVSLTFDDAIDDSVTDDVPVVPMDDVYQAARTLLTDEDELTLETSCPNVGGRDDAPRADERLDCDVPATFYVNYPRLDERAYFTTAAIQDLDAWGHEIGGHSAHHLEIPKLESDSTSLLDLREQKLQVCWDRQRISALPKRSGVGTLDVTSFAYPFGEDHWAGSPELEARFGPPTPLLGGSETHDLVGRNYPGDCAYRNARDVGNGVNTPECTDRDPATPCQFAEFPTRLQNRFALVAPGSIHDLTPLDYPVVPPNDDGDGIYDRAEEYEARAHTIKGWIDNAIATRAPGDKNWVMLTFHTLCFNQRCNSIGMEYHQFQELVTWLRQKRKAGDIEIRTVSQVLGDTRELKVVVPALAPPNTSVRNAQLGEDLNLDGFPDCFDSGGMGVYRSGVPIFTSTRADADENDNGLRDDGHGDRYYAYNVMAGGTTRGRFIVRLDLGQCSLSVVAGARYRAKFFYRRPALARTCNFADDPNAAPCPVPYAPAPPTGVAPQYSLIYAHRRPVSQTKSATEDGSWSTFTRVSLAAPNASWQAAQADILAPTGVNALSFGFEILHDQANGRVEVDVDDFSYCTLDPALDPTVPACAN